MKNLTQYITEFININNVKQYKYVPNNRKELVEAIKTELDKGNTDLNCIDTSNISNLSYLFDQDDGIELTDKQQKTLDVSKWDVSNVEDMEFLFSGCKYFNCDLSKWDVSKVNNMASMFDECEQFNSDISNWNVSNAIHRYNMFKGCRSFNYDLSNWI